MAGRGGGAPIRQGRIRLSFGSFVVLGAFLVAFNFLAVSTVLQQYLNDVPSSLWAEFLPRGRPPLDDIVQGWNITGDPSWLLDFAIIGFPKCGTSSMMFHLQSHKEIAIFGDERCDLAFNQQAKLITDLYTEFPDDPKIKRGIKCPMQLESNDLGMINFHKYFPNTKFIVGIRHPVLWFESFYNFRVHNEFKMPPAEKLIGKCFKGMWNVCTFRASFHLFLANLGKTDILNNPAELEYIRSSYRKGLKPIKTDSKVFLYEVSQLSDKDPVREVRFLEDLQRFLGLRAPIDSMMWFKPGKNHTDEKKLERLSEKKINICDERYMELRDDLMKTARDASRWIRDYFTTAPGVTVSSVGYFKEILAKWDRDPCLDRK